VVRPPLLGEHTAEVLEALCGLSAQEVRRLRGDGVV
jgi:crotonobetainyl-CoA:carnitine CoA-transferase CaiB-like acyl-CoA transferase